MLAFVNRTVYDLAGQVEAVVDVLGNRTSFTYDANGNQETVKNPLGFVSTTVYAPTSNRVLATVDPLGYRTTFSYDLAGQETGRQDARGNRITFAYDPVGRPRSIQNELGAFATTSYDAAGRPVTMLDANGWLKTITYDAAGQQTGILYPDNTKVTLQYDPVGNLTTTLYLSGSDQIVSYTARNEVDVVRLSGNIRYTNTYDQVGNRTLLRDTSDGRHTYSYDALNRVASFVSTESRVYTFSYDADSRRTTVNYGTGDRLTSYDALSRVVTQVERVGGSPILTIVDAYDSAGRKISQLRDSVLTSYTYDSADRLTGQQVTGAFATFTMDAVGNITVKSQQGSSPITMTYNAGSRLVTSVEGAVVSTYTFDANGNQTAVNAGGSRTTYAYDYENRMRTAIDPGGARSTLAYWADGMRRFLEVGGTRTTFVWDGSDYLQARTPSDVTTFSTVDAQILDSGTGGSESLLVPDPLGSVVKVLDASGNQLYDAWYWAYGETRLSVGVNNTPWGYGGTWGYHFDMSRRLYIRARVLDPVTGRWYSVDPLWPEESAYGYGRGTPTISIDPTGALSVVCKGCTKNECERIAAGIGLIQPNICPSGDPSNPDGFAGCVDDSGCRQPRGGTSPGNCICTAMSSGTITVVCDRKCSNPPGKVRCGISWKTPGSITICAPQAFSKPCLPTRCLILHEMIHSCGIPHSENNNPAWKCVNTVPGCEKYK